MEKVLNQSYDKDKMFKSSKQVLNLSTVLYNLTYYLIFLYNIQCEPYLVSQISQTVYDSIDK